MKTLIHYFKTRALRQITQWLIISACSILIIGAFAVADAYAQSTYLCSDLTGSTSGTCDIDEGCLDFDMEPPTSNFAAEVCSPQPPVVGDAPQNFELHGWVWDTNLGYVSLYCDATGKNNGVNCGSIPYGVKVDVTTGKMSGWAWSDNMGWISFGCQDGLNQGYACGGINYSTTLNTNVGDNLGKITGYAWADTVGWFNFQTGDVHAFLLDLVMRESTSATDWGVWTKAEIADGSLTPVQKNTATLKSVMPFADGTSGYEIFVHVSDIKGTPINSGGADGTTVDITLKWADTVKFDQTSTTPINFDNNNDGPAKKEIVVKLSSAETTEGIKYFYVGTAKSYAPTDGGNCYDGDGDDSCYTGEENFFYKDIVEGTQPNLLTYLGADITVIIDDTGETWTSPTITPLAPYSSGRPMHFKPIVDIPTLDYLFVPGDETSGLSFIQAIRNKADEFYIKAVDNGTALNYSVNLELSAKEGDVQYVFVDDIEQDPTLASSSTSVTKVSDLESILLAMPFSELEEKINQVVEGAKLTSIIKVVTALGETVSYYNNSLPRGADSEIQTQSAQIISGGVFSPGAKEVVQGSDVPLFGDVAVYELRTQILSDVSSLISGVNLRSGGLPSVVIRSGGPDISVNAFKEDRLYYFKDQDVTIEDISVLSNAAPGKPITVVVDGGDLYIENNIDEGQSFGFIVFESDDAVDGAFTTKGGRIYVHADVTDMVNVHIFADGPIFRYTDDVCYFWGNYGPSSSLVGLREPNFVSASRPCSSAGGSFKEPLSALVNQFYLKGNIASFNCLGCSTDFDPSRGDGLRLGGPSALNFAIARLYDLHYFAYFRQDPISGAFSGNRSTNVDALKATGKITNGDAAVYFEYVPAPTDLFGFRSF